MGLFANPLGSLLLSAGVLASFGLFRTWQSECEATGRWHYVSEWLAREPSSNAWMLFAGVALTLVGASDTAPAGGTWAVLGGLLLVALCVLDFSMRSFHVVPTVGMFCCASVFVAFQAWEAPWQPSTLMAAALGAALIAFQIGMFRADVVHRGMLAVLTDEKDTPELNHLRRVEWILIATFVAWSVIRGVEATFFGRGL